MAKSFSSLNIDAQINDKPQDKKSMVNRPVVMGIINATPDSFSDGGQFYHQHSLALNKVEDAAAQMVCDGAGILDIGGESTRPGAAAVSDMEEADRVLPVLERLASLDVVISLDSSNADLMREAATFGVGLINDVRALERGGAIEAVADLQLPVCLMHMRGTPKTMQDKPNYNNLLGDVNAYLLSRVQACEAAGILPQNIILDPGFGFGKTVEHNLSLLRQMEQLLEGRYPLLVGLSRKSMIEHVHQRLGESRDVSERLPGSLALALIAAQNNAAIVRVHDVKETVDAFKILEAYQSVSFNA